MSQPLPFDLVPLGDGRYELRAFSDDSDDPIKLTLDQESGRRLADALSEAIASPGRRDFAVPVGERLITLTADATGGVRITVTR